MLTKHVTHLHLMLTHTKVYTLTLEVLADLYGNCMDELNSE